MSILFKFTSKLIANFYANIDRFNFPNLLYFPIFYRYNSSRIFFYVSEILFSQTSTNNKFIAMSIDIVNNQRLIEKRFSRWFCEM